MAVADPSSKDRWSLKGMTALVTGGTRGIGYAIVEELAAFGAAAHTCSRNQTELHERLRGWEGKGFKVSGSVFDLASRDQREKLMETVSSVFDGKLNILVNNAAMTLIKEATNHSLEDYSSIKSTNVESPYHLSQIAHPLLKASGAVSIVFISSIAGVISLPYISGYSASKAINQITKNLACEWAKDNIRTNTVAPWCVRTTIVPPDTPHVEKFVELVFRTPISRFGEANEVSSVVAFLCLPAASYVPANNMCRWRIHGERLLAVPMYVLRLQVLVCHPLFQSVNVVTSCSWCIPVVRRSKIKLNIFAEVCGSK